MLDRQISDIVDLCGRQAKHDYTVCLKTDAKTISVCAHCGTVEIEMNFDHSKEEVIPSWLRKAKSQLDEDLRR